ncbi:hypothetical protein, partial [Trichormus variabilis]
MNSKFTILFTEISFLITIFTTFIPLCQAQINADNSSQNNSAVNVQGNTIFIEGGTQLGGNLFHSFK